MKKAAISLFLLTSFLSLGFISTKQNYQIASAKEELAISNSGDAFVLLDKQYDANSSFVYTADLHFKSGQAGGLAFGSEENDHYYVINMDRYENKVKLLYFATKDGGGYDVSELKVDYFIGNDKMTVQESNMISPWIRDIENVNLKVILTREDEHAYAEFFVEGIKRFGIDTVIDLNDLETSFKYEGGYLGMNCFNSDVYLDNIEIGKSDYSYFSEPYRNQYHLQPFAKWTNDPNALCYYNGYYHVFYQTHPFNLYWGSMFWGHARSRDLIHFEFLPLCLFPEKEGMGFGPGDAYMWSGCAITYTKGMSSAIDELNWFPNGNGNGILAIYTRDGGLQDQVVISSDDEGLTWTKRHRIPQDITGYTGKIDLRDPKVFPLKKDDNGKVQVWGMTLSSYALNKGWFLRSTDLLNWQVSGNFALPTPECIGIGFLTDNLGVEHAYLTNKSRTYILGTLEYNESNGQVTFYDEDNVDISKYSLDEMNARLKPLDFGPDTYASQSFYINDPASEFNGKDIVLNWFSGDLNASFCTGPGEYANLRGRWNGGFTMPVEYGVAKTNEGYRLTQKPITVNNTNLEKKEIVNISSKSLTNDSENPLKDVHTHIFELTANIKTIDNSPITFKVDVGDNEYMQFGWNLTDGYYVDRTYLDDKGINTNVDWHVKYASHILGDSDVKTFYVLSDNGGLEVFCEDFSIPFYFVTTASIYSTGASLKGDNILVNSLVLNEVASIYRKDVASDEGVLYVSSNEVLLDDEFATSKFVTCWFSGQEDLNWELISGEDVVNYTPSNQGINLVALQEGEATFKVSAGNQSQTIRVIVYKSTFTSDLSFNKNNIVSGQWIMAGDDIIGESNNGNGFLLANESGSDFTFTGQFDILSGTAASLVFRASSDMSSFLVANYDANEKVVKLWSSHGELARSGHIDISLENITLTVRASDKNVQVAINGQSAINYVLKDNEPLNGRFGINVFSSRAKFHSFSIAKENYEYAGGTLAVELSVNQYIVSVYNVTLGNRKLDEAFYYQNDGVLYIKESYFALLAKNTRYQFRIVGESFAYTINVDLGEFDQTITFEDMEVELGNDVNIYIGNTVVATLVVNGQEVESSKYYIKDYTLHISKDCFKEGENTVSINSSSFVIDVKDMATVVVEKEIKSKGCGGSILASSAIISFVSLFGVSLLMIKKKRGK